MKKKLGALTLLVSASLSSVALMGVDFTQADERFKERGSHNFQEVTQTRDLYKGILSAGDLTEEEKTYAVTQMSRLDVYRGAMLENIAGDADAELKLRKQTFDACLANVESLNDENREYQSAQYYYFHIVCAGYRGKLEKLFGRIKYANMVKKVQTKALEAARDDGVFEGGGIYRVMSAIRGNVKTKALKLYNPDEAVTFANKALETEAFENLPYPEMSGEDYYENYYYLGVALTSLALEHLEYSHIELAKENLNKTVAKIDRLNNRGRLGARKPESLHFKKLMLEHEGFIDACPQNMTSKETAVDKSGNESAVPGWVTCLREKLDD